MRASSFLSGVILVAALGAFTMAGALSLRAGVELLYAVVRGIAAFLAVLVVARWSASALDSLGPVRGDVGSSAARPEDEGSSGARSGNQIGP